MRRVNFLEDCLKNRNREVNELEKELNSANEKIEHLLIDLNGESEYKIRNEKALDYIQKHKLDKELPRSYEYVLEDILRGGNKYDNI